MRWLESRILWGSLFIVGGVLFLLQNLGVLSLGNLFWVILLGLGCLFFLSFFIQSRDNWWALIPGITLFSLMILILLNWFIPNLGANWGGSVLLGGIGLSFFIIYLVERANWWALIPGGVLLTLAATVGLEQFFPGLETAGIFFLGMGLTFGLVALLPNPEGEMRWAWIPAGILLFIGVVFMAVTGEILKYIWPVALIFAGVFLLFRSMRRRTGF
jgi:hypothetical protein